MSACFEIRKQTIAFVCVFLSMGSSLQVVAEEGIQEKKEKIVVLQKMQTLLDAMYAYYGDVPKLPANRLGEVERQIAKTNMRWESFYETEQSRIVEDSLLLNMAGDYQNIRQLLDDTIAALKHYFVSLDNFVKTEKLLEESTPVYEEYLKKATQLSMVQNLAPVLEKLKAEEQQKFGKIQASYEGAKAIVAEFPEFEERLKVLDEAFLALQMKSGKIQEAAYKPFFDRIKEYVLGLAAVSIILMFVSMVYSKVQTLKQQAANLKKMQEMINKDKDECPTI